MASVARFNSVRVLKREVQAADTVVLTVEGERENGTETAKLPMKKVGNEWKLSSGH